jgi:hypothetical protein
MFPQAQDVRRSLSAIQKAVPDMIGAPLLMSADEIGALRSLATQFRAAIERSIAEKATPHLPYFPDGACRLVSHLLALHLSRRGYQGLRYRDAAFPGHEAAIRHGWLVVDGATVDLTADPYGQPPVVVAAESVFHQSLTSAAEEDVLTAIAALPREAVSRYERFLVQIEARLAAAGAS